MVRYSAIVSEPVLLVPQPYRRRLEALFLIVGTCLILSGVVLAIISTFMPWLQDVVGSHQIFNGWDVVATNVWRPSQPGVGIHWLLFQSWADEPAVPVLTPLAIVQLCVAAVVCLGVTIGCRARPNSVVLWIVSWVPLGAGCVISLAALEDRTAWDGVNWRSKVGVSWLLVGGAFVVGGGVCSGLAELFNRWPQRAESSRHWWGAGSF